jgi:hypothetical protein
VMVNAVYVLLAVFIAVGRFGPESFVALGPPPSTGVRQPGATGPDLSSRRR